MSCHGFLARAFALATLGVLALGCEGGSADSNPDGNPAAVDSGQGGDASVGDGQGLAGKASFSPRQVGWFSKVFYPDGPNEQPAPGPGRDEAGLRALLSETLGRRAGLTADQVRDTVALFDAESVRKVVPAPALRAGLLLLRGTVGDAAIAAVQGPEFESLDFTPLPPGAPDTPAWVQDAVNDPAKGAIKLADWARFEDPRLYAAIIAHESLHADVVVFNKEEAICSAIEAVIYGQLVLESPGIAQSGSKLARYANTRLLERLNGRDETGALRVLYSAGFTMPRGQAGYGFMTEYYVPFSYGSPGPAALLAMTTRLTGETVGRDFSNLTLGLLDRRQVVLGPADILALASALDLDNGAAADLPAPASRTPGRLMAARAPSTGDAQALPLLAGPPFAPKNVALFDRGTYPRAPADVHAAAPGFDEAAARASLTAALTTRFGAGHPSVAMVLAAFDDATWKARVPSPVLRAALLSLRGLAADSAIDTVADGVFAGLDFIAPVPDLPFVAPLPPAAGQRPRLGVNGLLRYEHPLLIAPYLAAVVLHEDAKKTPLELEIAASFVPLLYAQLLLETPALARTGTRLGRILNRQLLARINSRDSTGRLRLTGELAPIFPGAPTPIPQSFLSPGQEPGPDTPGNPTLQHYLTATTSAEATTPANFDLATLTVFDEKQALLRPGEILTLARTLELDVPAAP